MDYILIEYLHERTKSAGFCIINVDLIRLEAAAIPNHLGFIYLASRKFKDIDWEQFLANYLIFIFFGRKGMNGRL